MAFLGFETETLLDLTVNVIPLLILGFFITAFLIVPTWGVDPVFSSLQFALLGSMVVLLSVLTYYAGRAVQNAEESTAE